MFISKRTFFESLSVEKRRDLLKAALLLSVDEKEKDASIMNLVLGLEHRVIAVYSAVAAAKLLSNPAQKLWMLFQSHHQEHRDALAIMIKAFGGNSVEAKASYDVTKIAGDFGIKNLESEKNIVRLVVKLEQQATSVYYGAMLGIVSKDVLKAALQIMANEAQHTALWRNTLGEDPAPSAFVS